jgi:CubicO group peptidase (beta-lactamase class C family)
VLAALTFSCSQAPESPSVAVSIDSLMTDLRDRGNFSGAVVVHRGDEIVYERGFGFANNAEQVPFTPDTPANGASLAKTLTAAALLMLEAEDRIGLDDPVSRYLPGFPYPAVTVRHLLTHSSGLRTSPPGEPPVGETITNELELEILAEVAPRLSFDPGSGFQYSNLAYDLAAMVIERVTGSSYASFLDERIFEPVGMDSAFIRPAWNVGNPVAHRSSPKLKQRALETSQRPFGYEVQAHQIHEVVDAEYRERRHVVDLTSRPQRDLALADRGVVHAMHDPPCPRLHGIGQFVGRCHVTIRTPMAAQVSRLVSSGTEGTG